MDLIDNIMTCREYSRVLQNYLFTTKYTADRTQLICIDSVGIREGDYVDLGSPIMNGVAIPVVVKTLVMV